MTPSLRFPLKAGGAERARCSVPLAKRGNASPASVPLAKRGNASPASVPLAKRGEPKGGGHHELWLYEWYYTNRAAKVHKNEYAR